MTTRERRADLQQRLDAVSVRLRAHADRRHDGLAAPDSTTGEERDAGQLWAHMAALGSFWIEQVDGILDLPADPPPWFGQTIRMMGTQQRAVEAGRDLPVETHLAAIEGSAAALRARLERWSDQDLERVARNESLGQQDVAWIVDRFVVGHYEEHASHLDSLVVRS